MKTLTGETVWSLTVPVLSTAHIDKDTNTLLGACAPGATLSGAVDVYPGPHGYFLHFLSGCRDHDADSDLPLCLKQIARWARIKDVSWVRLDGQLGDTTSFLREYDW